MPGNNLRQFSDYLVYIDESGDQSICGYQNGLSISTKSIEDIWAATRYWQVLYSYNNRYII